MKKTALSALMITLSVVIYAQTSSKPKPVAKPVSPPPVSGPVLKNLSDSASYAIGVSVASFYKQQGITSLNTALVAKAIEEIFGGNNALLDDQACNMAINKLMNKMQENKSKPVMEEGKAFLAKNKIRPEVKTTESGLQYEVVSEGTGIKPLAVDSVTVNYKGTLINGTEFDNSYTRGEPITFPLNRVIAGWTEGLQLMSVGSKYKLFIPHNLAYGLHDQGPIPGGSTLVFEVELLDVKKAK